MYRQLLALIWLLGLAAVSNAEPTVTPIVDLESGQLYGAGSGTGWLSAGDTEALVTKNTAFRAYTQDGVLPNTIALSRVETSETCTNPTYRASSALPTRPATLVGAPWNAAPRIPQALNTNSPSYRELVSIWLREQGIDDPKPVLSQLWRIDLEGDGRDEVLISASRHRGSITSTESGDYAVLLMRKIVDDNVATVAIQSDLYPEACIAECALVIHEIFNVLDLNGDGHLEIIIKSSDYESITQSIHSIDGTRVVKRLDWSCGS